MTRDEQLETTLHELTKLQIVCGEYGDQETARIAMEAARQLHKQRTPQEVMRQELKRGIA
jgi:hypothetical protein